VRDTVARDGFVLDSAPWPLDITVSIGLAMHRPSEAAAILINRADAAFYSSKNRGRNMVTLAAAA